MASFARCMPLALEIVIVEVAPWNFPQRNPVRKPAQRLRVHVAVAQPRLLPRATVEGSRLDVSVFW